MMMIMTATSIKGKHPVAMHTVRAVNRNYKVFVTDCPYLSVSNQTKVLPRPTFAGKKPEIAAVASSPDTQNLNPSTVL